MTSILILGAGMVARPLVQYLLAQDKFKVLVASRTLSKAEALIGNHPSGKAQRLDVTDTKALIRLISSSDLVISLLPYVHHMKVADYCIQYRKPMVTTSYVSKEMAGLDERARDAGIIILNEIGLDPGIDHMSAMKLIHDVQNRRGKVVSFRSYCGALPAPEAATNPFKYKFSWSPRGVVLAAKNSARYLKDGEEGRVSGEHLFDDCSIVALEGLGDFESYPNRDSLGYIEKYGISTAHTMFRGTLRYPGWCETWKSLGQLGFLDESEQELRGISYSGLLGILLEKITDSGPVPAEDLRRKTAQYLQIKERSPVIQRFDWLGLYSNESIPLDRGSPLDVLAGRLLEKLKYDEGERDMVALHHEVTAEYEGGEKQRLTSTLIDYGEPGGDTAVARTVALPAAVATKLIVQGKIDLKGVHIPVHPSIYEPVLAELQELGIVCCEKTMRLRE